MSTDPLKCLQLKMRGEREASVGAARQRKTRRLKSEWSKRKAKFPEGREVNNGKYCKQVKENAGGKKFWP